LSRLGFIDEEILMAFWSRWKRWQKWTAGIVGALFALGVMGSFVEKEVPNVVGSSLPDAVQVLKTEGFGTVSVTDEHGASVLKSHFADGFQVTAQAPGAGVKAKVSKAVSLTVRATPAPASLVSHKPTPSASPSPTPSPSPSTTPTPSPEPTTAEPTPEPTAQPEPAPQQAYYSSCREAKAAGAAPLYRGDPGYRSRLDRDGDGVACEK
jgi:hypothetical protein